MNTKYFQSYQNIQDCLIFIKYISVLRSRLLIVNDTNSINIVLPGLLYQWDFTEKFVSTIL